MKHKWLPLLLLLLLLTGCGGNPDTQASYQQISMEKAIELMNTQTGYLILDVRTQEEYDAAHIPGAICIPNESIGEEAPAQLPDKGQLILVYCRSGNRSKQAAEKLVKLGYTNILEFGGIIDWPGDTVSGIPDDPGQSEQPGVMLPNFSELEFFDTQTIAYTAVPVAPVDGTGAAAASVIPADCSVLVTGRAEGWVRIRQGAAQYYLPVEMVTELRPDTAQQAAQGCGGIVYPGSGPVVAIDPGHQSKGMKDLEPNGPGSDQMKAMLTSGTQGVVTKLTEYQLNLQVGLLLRDELISRGYTVVMIRESNDVTLSNVQRAQIANRAEAAAFVRIHANGSENAAKQGAYTICQTKKNPYNADLQPESLQLSRKVLDGFIAATGQAELSIWETDTMTGINWAEVPSTILEMGYMSNAEEDRRMAGDDFQKAAAQGVADGLDAFFAQ